jgi:hypothetical protein
VSNATTEPNAQAAKPQSESAKKIDLDLGREKHGVGVGILAATYLAMQMWIRRDAIHEKTEANNPKAVIQLLIDETGVDPANPIDTFLALDLGKDIRVIKSGAATITDVFVRYLSAIAGTEHGLIFLRRTFSHNLFDATNGDVGIAIAKTIKDFALAVSQDVRLISSMIEKQIKQEQRQAEAAEKYQQAAAELFRNIHRTEPAKPETTAETETTSTAPGETGTIPSKAVPNYCIIAPSLAYVGCYLLDIAESHLPFVALYNSFVEAKQVVQLFWRTKANHDSLVFVAQGAEFSDADDLHTWINNALSRHMPSDFSDRIEEWEPVLITQQSDFFLSVPATEDLK